MKRSNVHTRDPHSSNRDRKRAKIESQPEFPKLDQTDPAAAHRIQQRRRQVAKGKNTTGYDSYLKQIPKHKRRPRDHTQPSTPDHTLDIPNKRWQGLVKAWRKALHQYDPPDLLQAFEEEAAAAEPTTPAKKSSQSTTSVKAKQLSEAVEQGLLVDVSPTAAGVSPATLVSQLDVASPDKQEPVDELDEWDKGRTEDDEFFLDEGDSDDDLI